MKTRSPKLLLTALFLLALTTANCGGGSSSVPDSTTPITQGTSGIDPLIVTGAEDSADWTGFLTAQQTLDDGQIEGANGSITFHPELSNIQDGLWDPKRIGMVTCTLDALTRDNLELYVKYLGYRVPPLAGTTSQDLFNHLQSLIALMKLSLDFQISIGAYHTDLALNLLQYTQAQSYLTRINESTFDTAGELNNWNVSLPSFTSRDLLTSLPSQNPYPSPYSLAFAPSVFKQFSPPSPPHRSDGPQYDAYVFIAACSPN